MLKHFVTLWCISEDLLKIRKSKQPFLSRFLLLLMINPSRHMKAICTERLSPESSLVACSTWLHLQRKEENDGLRLKQALALS